MILCSATTAYGYWMENKSIMKVKYTQVYFGGLINEIYVCYSFCIEKNTNT